MQRRDVGAVPYSAFGKAFGIQLVVRADDRVARNPEQARQIPARWQSNPAAQLASKNALSQRLVQLPSQATRAIKLDAGQAGGKNGKCLRHGNGSIKCLESGSYKEPLACLGFVRQPRKIPHVHARTLP